MSDVITLAERHRRKMNRMTAAIIEIDAGLTAYARRHGGRFIRYGSSAKGSMRSHSDVDLIADFPTHEASLGAASHAEDLCHAKAMSPDVRPSTWTSERFLARAAAEGVILA